MGFWTIGSYNITGSSFGGSICCKCIILQINIVQISWIYCSSQLKYFSQPGV